MLSHVRTIHSVRIANDVFARERKMIPPIKSHRSLQRPRSTSYFADIQREKTSYLAGVLPYLSSLHDLASPLGHRRICFYCDNQAVVAILSAKSSKISRVMNLVRLITYQTLRFNFTFTARRVPWVNNGIANSLSRFQMSRFRLLVPDASPAPYTIPTFLTKD